MKRLKLSRWIGLAVALALTVGGCSDNGDNGPTGPNGNNDLKAKWRGSDGIGQLFSQKCTPCHTQAPFQAGFNVTSHAAITTAGGPIVPGDPANSRLIKKLEGETLGARMPQGGPYLTTAQIDSIKVWIQAGARDN